MLFLMAKKFDEERSGLIKAKLLHKYFTKADQFSCPISGVGRVKQFGMCGLNTESELTGDESRRSSWALGDAHIHLFYRDSGCAVRAFQVLYNLLSFFSFYRKACTAKRVWNIYICISAFLQFYDTSACGAFWIAFVFANIFSMQMSFSFRTCKIGMLKTTINNTYNKPI